MFAWTAAIAGAVTVVVFAVHVIPAVAWKWIGLGVLAIALVSYTSAIIWINKRTN